jgi:hypothetical protein
MAKPIIVITLDNNLIEEVGQMIEQRANDVINGEYFVFVIYGEKTGIQVFYEKDFNQVKYEELKAIIEKEVFNATNKI